MTEVTLQCVDAHRLMERTRVATRAQVRRHHKRWLRQNAHLRYMWIPYTDAVVVVSSRKSDWTKPLGKGFLVPDYSETERLAPLRELLRGAAPERATADIEALSATGLRDAALALDPLRREWVAAVNAAEAEYWRRSEGYRLGWSDEILGFDCGGQQHVLEVAFPTGGSAKDPTLRVRLQPCATPGVHQRPLVVIMLHRRDVQQSARCGCRSRCEGGRIAAAATCHWQDACLPT